MKKKNERKEKKQSKEHKDKCMPRYTENEVTGQRRKTEEKNHWKKKKERKRKERELLLQFTNRKDGDRIAVKGCWQLLEECSE